MKSVASRPALQRTILISAGSSLFAIALGIPFAGSMAGCGGHAVTGPSGNTTVTLFITGTANDRLLSFWVGLNTLTLTSQSGTQVDLLSSPILPEFLHVNGTIEPYLTVSIPQDTYTSATATSGGGYAACDIFDSNRPGIDSIVYNAAAPAAVNIALPSPIVVTGANMGLVLNSLVTQSAVVPGNCALAGSYFYSSYTPTFVLTPLIVSGQPTNSANGKALRLEGMIASVDANGSGFSLARMYDQPVGQTVTWQVTSSASTTYQGVSGFSQLAVGMPVDMDASVQIDGSLLASRVAIYDTNTANLTEVDAPLLNTNTTLSRQGIATDGLLDVADITADGISQGSVLGHLPLWDYSGATFQVSGQLSNVANLPFAPSFGSSNIVPGQHIVATTHDTAHDIYSVNGYSGATTITLVPQTVNGTVSAVGSQGGFATYTVTLAPYDIFPAFAVQPGQATLLTNPNTVVVYADSNTAMLNTAPIAVGNVVRFYGLVFNDNGTLRMDCAQVMDGVPE